MQHCDHDFFEVRRDTPKGKKTLASVIVVCAYCGHRRCLYESGTVEVGLSSGELKFQLSQTDASS